jgi:hypothetical protein
VAVTPRIPSALRQQWRDLADAQPPDGTFSRAAVAGLPEPARRWLTHAIADGTPLASCAELEMHGTIRIGRWRPFTARQVLRPSAGFIWKATARVAGVPVVGFDRYTAASGQMRWRLAGLVPVMSGADADITRSAAGRLAAEGAVLLPTSFRIPRWDGASATWSIDGCEETVELDIGAEGTLRGVSMLRWGNPDGNPNGNPDGGSFGRYPFGVTVDAERQFGGIRIPARFRAGWWHGTAREGEGEFFRAEITAATFR